MKTVWVQAHGGSNPSASATSRQFAYIQTKKTRENLSPFFVLLLGNCLVLFTSGYRICDARIFHSASSLFRRFAPYESLRFRHTESRLNTRLFYFCIKGISGIIYNSIKYEPQWSDNYLNQKRVN